MHRFIRGCSSIGRALESHSRGRGFDSLQLQMKMHYLLYTVSLFLLIKCVSAPPLLIDTEKLNKNSFDKNGIVALRLKLIKANDAFLFIKNTETSKKYKISLTPDKHNPDVLLFLLPAGKYEVKSIKVRKNDFTGNSAEMDRCIKYSNFEIKSGEITYIGSLNIHFQLDLVDLENGIKIDVQNEYNTIKDISSGMNNELIRIMNINSNVLNFIVGDYWDTIVSWFD